MTQLKDVLHLYLGCTMQSKIKNKTTLTLDFLNDLSDEEDLYGYRPILRPLSDLTKEERDYLIESEKRIELWDEETRRMLDAHRTRYLLSIFIDLFNLIGTGQAIDKTKHKTNGT